MPPSPIITITYDERLYADVCKELAVYPQPSLRFVRNAKGNKFYGDYSHLTRAIRVFSNCEEFDRNRLPFVQHELVRTLLHELRHAWQHTYWSAEEQEKHHQGTYPYTFAEEDAEGWAVANSSKWRGLVTVKRKFHGSGMSKLGKTQAAIRQSV